MKFLRAVRTVLELANQVDNQLQRAEEQRRIGRVSATMLVNPDTSYFYLDGNTLKFYNIATSETKLVDLT